jgi:uncharacterized protein (DUF302 family)
MKNFIFGVIIGIALTGFAVWSLMPKLMLTTHESKFNVDQTVAEIEKSSKAIGWQVPKIYFLQKSLQKAGYKEMSQMKILSICKPVYAYDILKNDSDKMVSAIMPCRLSVYEDKSGKVFVSGMNMGLMSKMFGGNIAKVMAGVAEEEHNILKSVIKE